MLFPETLNPKSLTMSRLTRLRCLCTPFLFLSLGFFLVPRRATFSGFAESWRRCHPVIRDNETDWKSIALLSKVQNSASRDPEDETMFTPPNHKVRKIGRFMQALMDIAQKACNLGEHASIDEQVVLCNLR